MRPACSPTLMTATTRSRSNATRPGPPSTGTATSVRRLSGPNSAIARRGDLGRAGALDHRARAEQCGDAVDVGVEHREQRLHVAAGAGGGEPLGHVAHRGAVARQRAPRAAPDRLPGPAGELATGAGRPAHDLGHGVEREVEHVVQHEGGAFGGGQAIEHHAEGPGHLVVERDPIGRIGTAGRSHGPARRHRRLTRLAGHLAAHVGRPHAIERNVADDDGQPSAQVVDGVDVGPGEAAERVLHDVLGLGAAADDALRLAGEEGAVGEPHVAHAAVGGRQGGGAGVHGHLQDDGIGHPPRRGRTAGCDVPGRCLVVGA